MINLPKELIREISERGSIYEEYILINTNKRHFAILSNKFKTTMSCIIKIQNFYKNNLPLFPEVKKIGQFNIDITKNKLVRIYIASYPYNLLLNYPEFFTKKISTIILMNEDKLLELKSKLKNLPLAKHRTLRDIKKFLMNKYITVEDILYTGW